MKHRIVRHTKLISGIVFVFVLLAAVVIPTTAQATYTRTWTVIAAKRETFFLWSWEKVEEKTITVTVTEGTRAYYEGLRTQQYAEELRERHRSLIDWLPYYKWLVVTGAQEETVKSVVTQLKALGLNETYYVEVVSEMVTQMRYHAGLPPRFAVETIVDGFADCDGFAVFAATILKASGYQVGLILYRKALHVQVIVHLTTAPRQLSEEYPIYALVDQGITYYPLECGTQTANWRDFYWRPGELEPYLVDEFKKGVYIVRL